MLAPWRNTSSELKGDIFAFACGGGAALVLVLLSTLVH
jgi:hypothetical protein